MPLLQSEALHALPEQVGAALGVDASQFELYALVPLNTSSPLPPTAEVAVKLKQSGLSVQTLETALVKQEQLQYQLNRCREALSSYQTQFAKQLSVVEGKYQRKVEKLVKVNSDNKKLRQLLKDQLENSEALRKETQVTVDTLKEEFERLVQEINSLNGGTRRAPVARTGKT